MEKEINIGDVVKYLSRAFSKAAIRSADAVGTRAYRSKDENGIWTTTKLYEYQVEFAHLINNIQRCPRYISTKSIQRANELIAELEAEIN